MEHTIASNNQRKYIDHTDSNTNSTVGRGGDSTMLKRKDSNADSSAYSSRSKDFFAYSRGFRSDQQSDKAIIVST
jgi:hypothetical protein